MINLKIFRDSDIRGIYPDDLNEEAVMGIVDGLVSQFGPHKVAIGMDMRVSGPSLKQAAIDRFVDLGVEVVDLGLITTPMSFYASWKLDVDLSIIISASHNPKEYNGLIITARGGEPVGKEMLKELAKVVNDRPLEEVETKAEVQSLDITDEWVSYAFSIVGAEKIKPLKVVLDNGNSVTSVALQPALERLIEVEAVKLFWEPDGTFPNHMPNPLLLETLKDLKETVKKEEADLGIAYDGDGDRMMIVDEKGEFVTGSELTAYLDKYLLEQRKYQQKPTFLYTTVMSRIVPETIERYGGRAVQVGVGHANIKAQMKKEGAVFAGEHSGHFYFKENHNADSALLATLLILAAVSSDTRSVSEQMKEFRVYAQNEEISLRVEDRDEFIKKATELFTSEGKPKISQGDGVTFDYPGYWFNLRPSGTEPVVRLNIEAYQPDKLEGVVKQILKIVEQAGGEIKQ